MRYSQEHAMAGSWAAQGHYRDINGRGGINPSPMADNNRCIWPRSKPAPSNRFQFHIQYHIQPLQNNIFDLM